MEQRQGSASVPKHKTGLRLSVEHSDGRCKVPRAWRATAKTRISDASAPGRRRLPWVRFRCVALPPALAPLAGPPNGTARARGKLQR